MNEPDDTRSQFQRDWAALRELEQPPSSGSIGPWLSKRYSNAYTAAHAIVIIGKAIKAIAIVMFLIVFIAGFSIGRGGGYATGGFALALIVGIPVHILGIIVAALGQIARPPLIPPLTRQGISRMMKSQPFFRSDLAVSHEPGLANRWSQPLAVVMCRFDFMKQSIEFATLAPASGGSSPLDRYEETYPSGLPSRQGFTRGI